MGFRPGVYRLAERLGLVGFVFNDTKGVTVEVQGEETQIGEFLYALKSGPEQPRIAKIKSMAVADIPVVQGDREFVISRSEAGGAAISEVTADIAVCRECLEELDDVEDFRYRYPFINCTNCGPRYSIIKSIPYDRPNTTMSEFRMCDNCSDQYAHVTDRRFHAQPVACQKCGPRIWLTDPQGNITTNDNEGVIATTAKMLRSGKIVAIKGIGGFHLAVDALNEEAVTTLRQRKHREAKPFALMAVSVETIKRFAQVSPIARKELESYQAPVVLLEKKDSCTIAPSVAQGFCTLGFMLCYTPLHYMIFEQDIDVLVMTSANLSDEPLICDNDRALEKLGNIADAFLMHDRDIYRQIDDSVVHIIDNKPVPLRRARGYVPASIESNVDCGADILATGSDLKNTFCFVKKNKFIPSEHIGDLAEGQTYRYYLKSIEHLANLFEVEPRVIACDLHPGYLSTQYAQSLPEKKILYIQHHWAHAASVLAENGTAGPVIAIIADGTGYGSDGAIWGCECLIASLEKFDRFAQLAYFPLPGADLASKEAIRPLLGLVTKVYPDDLDVNLLERIEPDTQKIRVIRQQIEKKLNTVETSSLGRVFDAVAALMGIGTRNSFDAELPMKLQGCIKPGIEESYSFEMIPGPNAMWQLDLSQMVREIIVDVRANVAVGVMAGKFHNCFCNAFLAMALEARKKTKLKVVALSGGVFCNSYLAQRTIKLLKENDFDVLFNTIVPSNDGGVSLGQAAIAVALVDQR